MASCGPRIDVHCIVAAAPSPTVAANPAKSVRKPKQSDVCRKIVRAFSTTQTAQYLLHLRSTGTCCRHGPKTAIGSRPARYIAAALLLAVPLIRLNEKLAIEDVDLADICVQRLHMMFDGD